MSVDRPTSEFPGADVTSGMSILDGPESSYGSEPSHGSGSRSRGPAPRAPQQRPPRRRLPRPVGLLVVVLVLTGLVAGLIAGVGVLFGRLSGGSTPNDDYAGIGVGSVLVQVTPGTATHIGDALVKAHVVKSLPAFTRAANSDPKSLLIQPGYYKLHQHMSAGDAITLMLDPSARAETKVTIPEGSSVQRTLSILAKNTGLPLAQLQAAAKNTAALGLPAWATPNPAGYPEGYLFPATYDIVPGSNGQQVLRLFTSRFNQEVDKLNLVAGAAALGQNPRNIVALASIIEGEAAGPGDRAKIARVIYNRLQDTGDFPTLGLDSTVRYALNGYTGVLHQSQLQVNSPYNTRIHPGLPPGPINNPGEASLLAAMHPVAGPWMYFVTLPKENKTEFAVTPEQFNQLEAELRREGG
jgi:UPF0755 protein